MEAKRLSYKEADLFQYYLEEAASGNKSSCIWTYRRCSDLLSGRTQYFIKEGSCLSLQRCKSSGWHTGTFRKGAEFPVSGKLVNKSSVPLRKKSISAGTDRRSLHRFLLNQYIWKGIQTLAKGKIEVPVLDGTAIGVSVLRGDTATAGSIMFLLGIGELLEEWTHKKSVGDLARSMSLNVEKSMAESWRSGNSGICFNHWKRRWDHCSCRKHYPLRWCGNSRRCDRKSGFSDRRICTGCKKHRFLCLCRYCIGRGRAYHLC